MPVVEGPERAPAGVHFERIVVEEDEDRGDSFGAPTRGPKNRFTHAIGVVVRIFAQVTGSGAAVGEHRRRARAVLHRVLIALDGILRGDRKNMWLPDSGRFVVPTDAEGTETWPGAVYELRFTVNAGVQDLDWAGDGAATGTIEVIRSRTRVALNQAGLEQDELACGGT